MPIFHRPPHEGALSLISVRLGIAHAISSGSFSADQQAALHTALVNGDVQNYIASSAGSANIADPLGAAPAGGRNWSAFFQSFGAFLVQIMPLIEQLISAFGGGALAPAKLGAEGGKQLGFALPPQLLVFIEQTAVAAGEAAFQAAWPAIQAEIQSLLKPAA